jgi:DNA-binding PadR family transcriptional regulator
MPNDPSDLGRFSDPAMLILASLAAEPRHGYAIMEDIASFSGTRFEPGTLYGALARLEHAGLIEPLEASGRRRPYALTAAGTRLLEARLATLDRVVDAARLRLRWAPASGPAE